MCEVRLTAFFLEIHRGENITDHKLLFRSIVTFKIITTLVCKQVSNVVSASINSNELDFFFLVKSQHVF